MKSPASNERLIAELYARTVEDANGCYIWQGSIAKNGYGRVSVGGHRTMSAHRRVLSLHLGRDIPRHMDACHHCDVRACIRLEHLFEGTRSDNMRDAANKGRNSMQLHPETNHFGSPEGRLKRARGERHGSAKLTVEEAVAVLNDTRRRREIAADYGLTTRTVGQIKSGALWRGAIEQHLAEQTP